MCLIIQIEKRNNINSSKEGHNLFGCPKYSDFFYDIFNYIFILDSIVFEFEVSWSHLTYHCWFESMSINNHYISNTFMFSFSSGNKIWNSLWHDRTWFQTNFLFLIILTETL